MADSALIEKFTVTVTARNKIILPISAFLAYRVAMDKSALQIVEYWDLVPAVVGGVIGGGWRASEEVDSFKPYTIPMNNVVIGLGAGLEEDVGLARTVAERFGPVTAKLFEVAKFADLTFPSDDELAAMTQAPNTGT